VSCAPSASRNSTLGDVAEGGRSLLAVRVLTGGSAVASGSTAASSGSAFCIQPTRQWAATTRRSYLAVAV
jgi:hypothetical protein